MYNNSLLEKIKSKYIIQNIDSYIEDNNCLYLLIIYSKSLQNKLGINLENYKERYRLNSIFKQIKWKNYLKDTINIEKVGVKKAHVKTKIMKEEYQKFLLKNKISEIDFKNNAIKYFRKYPEKFKKKYKKDFKNNINSLIIDMESPLFDILSTTEYFNKIFIVNINLYLFGKINDGATNNYMVKSNSSSLEINNLKYLKKFKINLQIKHLNIWISDIFENNILFEDLFSFIIPNNLVSLSFKFSFIYTWDNCFNIINNLKTLKHLHLAFINFENIFLFELNNLEILELDTIENNLQFKNNNFPKLKSLNICNCKIKKLNSLLKCPNLETLKTITKTPNNNFNYNDIFDFSSFINLKNYSGDIKYFNLLTNSKLLENIKIDEFVTENEFIKIIALKNLKIVSLGTESKYINYLNLCNIKDVNLSTRKLYIENYQNFGEIQKKFPNLEELLLSINNLSLSDLNLTLSDEILKIYIIENPKCKINKINIKLNTDNYFYETFNFYIQSYEKLESVKFSVEINENILETIFPIFNKNCNIIFRSLILLKLKVDSLRKNIIKNIYINIDNMPNLGEFILYFNYCKNHDKELNTKFTLKMLSIKNIKRVKIIKDEEIYSINELKKLFPNIKFHKFDKLKISRLFIEQEPNIDEFNEDANSDKEKIIKNESSIQKQKQIKKSIFYNGNEEQRNCSNYNCMIE